MSKLRHTVEEQQKTLEAMAGMPSLCCQTCAMHDACFRRSAATGKDCPAS